MWNAQVLKMEMKCIKANKKIFLKELCSPFSHIKMSLRMVTNFNIICGFYIHFNVTLS